MREGGVAVRWTRGKFTVFVEKISETRTYLRVACLYQQKREDEDGVIVEECDSSGRVESEVHDFVRAKISGDELPEVRKFKTVAHR